MYWHDLCTSVTEAFVIYKPKQELFELIKKVIISLCISFLFLLGAATLFVYLNQDALVHEVKSRLKEAGVVVDMRNIKVDPYSAFPNISVGIADIELATKNHQPILTAQEALCSFTFWKALSGEFDGNNIVIRHGRINFQKDEKGNSNFQFTSQSDKRSRNVELDFENLTLEDVDFIFQDRKEKHFIHLINIDAQIAFKLLADEFIAEMDVTAIGKSMSLSGQNYFSEIPIDGHLTSSGKSDMITIRASKFQLADTYFSFVGKLDKPDASSSEINLTFNEIIGRIEALPTLLPFNWLTALETYKISGSYRLLGEIKGGLADGNIPHIQLKGKVQDVAFSHDALIFPIKNVTSDILFNYGANEAGRLICEKAKGEYQNKDIGLMVELKNFDDINFRSSLKGIFNLADINPEIIPDMIVKTQGLVQIDSLGLRYRNGQLDYKGKLRLFDVGGMLTGLGFNFEKGLLEVNTQSIKMFPSIIRMLGEEHDVAGSFDLMKKEYALDIKSAKFHLDHFITEISRQAAQTKTVNDKFTDEFNLVIKTKVDHVIYNAINLHNVDSRINLTGNNLLLNSNFDYCSGSVSGNMKHDFRDGNTDVDVETHGTDIRLLFEEWENFGQSQIVSSQIVGHGDLQCAMTFRYIPGRPWQQKSLDLIGGIRIQKGELHNVPLFQQFASYIHVEDLARIKFSSLNNVFKVQNGRFFLPEMFIQSNAANLTIAGHQTLDNNINYAIRLNAGQVLAKKIKRHNRGLHLTRARHSGFFNLYYVLDGPIDNFSYRANKRRAKNKFQRSLFIRDEIIQGLSEKFDIQNRYQSQILDQDIPEQLEDEKMLKYLEKF